MTMNLMNTVCRRRVSIKRIFELRNWVNAILAQIRPSLPLHRFASPKKYINYAIAFLRRTYMTQRIFRCSRFDAFPCFINWRLQPNRPKIMHSNYLPFDIVIGVRSLASSLSVVHRSFGQTPCAHFSERTKTAAAAESAIPFAVFFLPAHFA